MNGGDKQSLTQQFNVVKKLRDMGATSIQVGEIIVHFSDPSVAHADVGAQEEHDNGYVDDGDAVNATQRWYRNGGGN